MDVYFKRIVTKTKRIFKLLLVRQTSPHSIALGVALGCFFSVLPTPGVSSALVLLISYFWKKVNRLAALASLLIFNPFFLSPVYAFAYYLGECVLKLMTMGNGKKLVV